MPVRFGLKRVRSGGDGSLTKYKGVSLEFVEEFYQQLLSGELDVASQVQLYVYKGDKEREREGDAVEFEKNETVTFLALVGSRGLWLVSRANGEQVPCDPSLLELKPRRDWTMQDLVDFVILEATKDYPTYLDTVEPEYVGSPYRGAIFINQGSSMTTRFGEVVNSVRSHFDKKDYDEKYRFVWIDVFCVNHHRLKRIRSKQSREEEMAGALCHAFGKFDQRIVLYSVPDREKSCDQCMDDHDPEEDIADVICKDHSEEGGPEVLTQVMDVLGHPTTVCFDSTLVASLYSQLTLTSLGGAKLDFDEEWSDAVKGGAAADDEDAVSSWGAQILSGRVAANAPRRKRSSFASNLSRRLTWGRISFSSFSD